MQPQWAWRLLGPDGRALDRSSGPVFTARFDAEQWLGEHWRPLAADDVHAAQLLHDGSLVGRPVTLRPAVPDDETA